jgi:hypothetical protein
VSAAEPSRRGRARGGALTAVALFSAAALLCITAPLAPAASSAAAVGRCHVAGARRFAHSRILVVLVTRDTVYGCQGGSSPFQLETLFNPPAACRLLTVRLAAERYVGIDVYCDDSELQITTHQIESFDLRRRKLLYGDPSTPDDSARTGFVMTESGALAWVDDFPGGSTQLQVWDRRSNRNFDFRTLDTAAQPSQIAGLRASGSTISWLHGGKRRTARIM